MPSRAQRQPRPGYRGGAPTLIGVACNGISSAWNGKDYTPADAGIDFAIGAGSVYFGGIAVSRIAGPVLRTAGRAATEATARAAEAVAHQWLHDNAPGPAPPTPMTWGVQPPPATEARPRGRLGSTSSQGTTCWPILNCWLAGRPRKWLR